VPLTSVSLLDRLKVARADASDWSRFEAMYRPLIHRWIGKIPGLGTEVDDVAESSGEHQLRSAAFPWGRVSAGGFRVDGFPAE
jgi:hypothetical protein